MNLSKKVFKLFAIRSGFTLIELIVVFSLIAILSGVGYASFADYSRVQQVNQNANDIELFINEARADALSAVYSSRDLNGDIYSCNNAALKGYSVQLISSNTLELSQLCDGLDPHPIKTKTLPSNLGFDVGTSCTTITFDSLTAQGSGLPCNFVIKGYTTLHKSICIDGGGNAAVKDSC